MEIHKHNASPSLQQRGGYASWIVPSLACHIVTPLRCWGVMIRNGAQRILPRLGAHVRDGAGKPGVQVILAQFPHNTWPNDDLCAGTFRQHPATTIQSYCWKRDSMHKQFLDNKFTISCFYRNWYLRLTCFPIVPPFKRWSWQFLATGKPSRVCVLVGSAIVPHSLLRPHNHPC